MGKVNPAPLAEKFTACETEIHQRSDEKSETYTPKVEPGKFDLKIVNAASFAEDHGVKTTEEVSQLHTEYSVCIAARHPIIALYFGGIGA